MNKDYVLVMQRVEELLLEAHESCMVLSGNKRTIVHFLMHELFYFFLTHLARKQIVVDYDVVGSKFISTDNQLRFGYRNHKFLPLELKESFSIKKRLVFFIFAIIDLLTLNKLPRLYIGQVSFRFDHIVLMAIRKRRIPRMLGDISLGIDTEEASRKILFTVCEKLCDITCLPKQDVEQFFTDLEIRFNHIAGLSSPSQRFFEKTRLRDLVLAGSTGKLINRALVYRGNNLNIPVIGCLHGSECGAADHLSWTFDDYTCCDILLGYGAKGEILVNRSRQSFLGDHHSDIHYIPSSCEVVQKLVLANIADTKREDFNFSDARALYVSSRVRGVSIINRVDYFSPLKYIQMVRSFLGKNRNVDFKPHPKGDDFDVGIERSRYVDGDLQEVISHYDCVIMDFACSTAFAIVAASNLPIVLLDTGSSLKGLSVDGKHAVMSRVQLLRMTSDDISLGVTIAPDYKLIRDFDNQYTESFCLGDKGGRRRLDVLAEVI